MGSFPPVLKELSNKYMSGKVAKRIRHLLKEMGIPYKGLPHIYRRTKTEYYKGNLKV